MSPSNATDFELVQNWKHGDELAASILVERYAFRLVALIGSRLTGGAKQKIDPEDVVQSAFGSFFNAVQHSRLALSNSIGLWQLLAIFAKRKLARNVERMSTQKRSGDRPLEDNFDAIDEFANPNVAGADDLLAWVRASVPNEVFRLVPLLLAGNTQRETAQHLGIDERTVRRRIAILRKCLGDREKAAPPVQEQQPVSLAKISYGEFVLGKLIGAGGFGKVYRAVMQSDGSSVAVKFLRKALWQNRPARQSFFSEVDLASKVNHPAIAQHLGWGESPHGAIYVLTRLVSGGSLYEAPKMDESTFVKLLIKICEGVASIHQHDLVHGDITPRNILIEGEQPLITDFGLAQKIHNANECSVTNKDFSGTLGFAAPEQLSKAFGEIGERTDVYGIGGLIAWQLTGSPPNQGVNISNVIEESLSNGSAERMRAMKMPLARLASDCLQLATNDRLESVQKILWRLKQIS